MKDTELNVESDSYYTHVLLEVFCSHGWGDEERPPLPLHCKRGSGKPGYDCLANDCGYITYTRYPDGIVYVDSQGEVSSNDAYIGFGGEMEPDDCDEEEREKLLRLWESICKRKIKEAYQEYMEARKSLE